MMNRLGPGETKALGTWLIVAFVVAFATCAARCAIDIVLSLGMSSNKRDTVPAIEPAQRDS